MAGIEDFNPTQFFTNAADGASSAVYPILWTAILAGAVILFFWYFSHRHKVRIRLLTSTQSEPFDDKAREIKVDGVKFWKLLKKKDVIPIPPSNALVMVGKDFLGKQKFYTEMFWSEEDGYIPNIVTVSKDTLKSKLQMVDSQNRPILTDAFQPFTTQQRALAVAQFRKAEARKKKTVLEAVTQLAVPIALVFLALIALFFWEDIARPAREMAELNAGMLKQQETLLKSISEISAQNARIVNALVEGSAIPIVQGVNPDTGAVA